MLGELSPVGGKERGSMSKTRYFESEGPWSNVEKLLLCMDTGSWRTKRPVIHEDLCIYCGNCALYCPVQCMSDMKTHFAPNLNFCKGCGICAKECPKKAITMESEEAFR